MFFMDFSSKIVLDPGSCHTKGGFSHEDNPRMVITSVKEEQYTKSSSPYIYPPRNYVMNTFTRPMQKGIVTEWDQMEKLYTQMLYNELNLEGQVQNYPGMILVENMCNTRRGREKTAELMFDKFGVNSLCMYSAPLLSLLASSNVHKKQMYSGVVVELGYTNSFVVPVDNFTVYSDAWAEIAYGGQHITNHLTELLSKRPGNSGSGDYESAKTEYACVSQNFAFEPDSLIRLSNGQLLGKERFACTEPLFAENGFGLPQNIVNLTEKACHYSALKHKDLIKQNVINRMAIRENLCSNIVLSGYTATIPGLCTRLQSELAKVPFYPSSFFTPSLPNPVAEWCGAWKGAALMANMDAFAHLWVSRAEFEDAGMQILFKKWLPVNTLK